MSTRDNVRRIARLNFILVKYEYPACYLASGQNYRYAKTDCLFPVQLLVSVGNTRTGHEQKVPTASQYI